MRTRPAWLLPASLLLALVVTLLPLPADLAALRPFWLGLVMAYWVMEAPDRAGLGFACVVGLLGDLVIGSLLGEQALRLVVLTFILQRFRARIRFFPLWQQSLAIGAVLLNDRVVAAAVHMALGIPAAPTTVWLSPLIAMVCWPPVFLLLDALRLGHWRRG